jgi:hypothetical protein
MKKSELKKLIIELISELYDHRKYGSAYSNKQKIELSEFYRYELQKILNRPILKESVFNEILLNFNKLLETSDGSNFIFSYGTQKLFETYLGSPINSIRKTSMIGDHYDFRDKFGTRHITTLDKGNIIKMGPAANQKDENNFYIMTQRVNKVKDRNVLATHLKNIWNLIDEKNIKEFAFKPETQDNLGPARETLFIKLLQRYYPDKFKSIDKEGDLFIVKLK